MSSRLQAIEGQFGANKGNLMLQLRQKYPVCRKEVRNLIYGEKYATLADQCFDVILQNRHIFEHADIEEYSRKEEREKQTKMVLTYHKLRPFKGPDYLSDPHSLTITAHVTYNFDPGFSVKCDVSTFLYAKTIYNFGRKDSKLHQGLWNRALALKDIGCFGLTQFGHGSNVKNLETEAVYDKQTKQFVLNMPTKQAMKFWIGAAAQLANMSVIWAQLIVQGKKYGPHPFLVPLRDPKTMDLLPGVTVGDCGHKNGLNGIDNGYIILDHVRIPKSYALDAISGVKDSGQFWAVVENADKRLGMYMNPLSVGRSFVAANSVTSAASALAIAIRYASQRRQFSGPKQTEQKIILEYPLTKLRLMPLLAKNFIYFFGGLNILRLYDSQIKNLTDPKNKLLNQLHAISSVSKAQSSWFTMEAISESREILGGHGYSSYSRLGRLFSDNDMNSTWEGDNNMLLQQTTKYVLKTASRIQKGKMFDDSILLFLKDEIVLPEKLESSHLLDLKILEEIIKHRIAHMVQQTLAFMFKMKGENMLDMDIWNYAQPFYGKKLAFAFGDLYYLTVIKSKLESMSPALREITEQCIRLWILTTLEKERWGNFETRKVIQDLILELCDWLTPRSVSLVDSIAAPSEIIGSPFADDKGEGMRKYVNLLFSGKDTFKRVDWFDKIVELRNNQ